MNLFDALLVALALAAAVGGFRLGFVARSASWLGMAVGLLVGARISRSAAEQLGSDPTRALMAVAVILLAGALAGQLLGLLAGSRLRLTVPGGRARWADRRLGAAAGVGGVVLAVWLLLPIITALRSWPARQAQDSALAGVVADNLPDPPDTLRSLAGLVGPLRWQELLTGLPVDPLPDPPVSSGLTSQLETVVGRSIVKIDGAACDNGRHGSGFVAEGELVVTNAHVVAGVTVPMVIDESQASRPARVVVFDSGRDLAILEVPGLDAPVLHMGGATKGDSGAVFGYPGSGGLFVSPYKVGFEHEVSMPDLYDQNGPTSSRKVLFIAANLQPGDSGSPLVSRDGRVIGVAFAISRKDPNLAFALTIPDVNHALDAARQRLAAHPDYTETPSRCLPAESAGAAASTPR